MKPKIFKVFTIFCHHWLFQVFALDPDTGANGQVRFFMVVNSGDNLFSINSISGIISTNSDLDREEVDTRVVEIVAEDLGQPIKNSTALVYIHILGTFVNHYSFS